MQPPATPPLSSGRYGGSMGHGLLGMRERAATVGGSVRTGPGPGGGFLVEAELPTKPDAVLTSRDDVLASRDDALTSGKGGRR